MKDQSKTKQILIQEMASLKQKIADLERSEPERKQVEEDIKEQEGKLASIFRAAPVGIGIVINRIFEEVNDKLCKMTGYSREELLGQSARILYPTQKDFNYVGQEKYRQIADKGTGTVETRWKTKDGRVINIILSSAALDPDNHAKGVTFTALDITDRKLTNEELRDSESKYQFLAESMADVVFTLDINLVTTYVSPSIERMLGYTPEERIAQKVDQQLTLNSQKLAFEALVAELDREKEKGSDPDRSQTLELEYYHKDGSIKHLVTYIRGIRDSEGNLTGFYGSHHDITDRKLAEETFKLQEMQLRTILESTGDGILAVDNAGSVIKANRSFAELWKIPSDLLERGNDEALLTYVLGQLVDPGTFLEKVHALYASKTEDFDTILFRDGRIVERYSCPLLSEGVINGRVWSFRDITERKKAEEALRESKERYRTLVENASDIVFRTDNSGYFTFVNPAGIRITGYEEQEIIGKHYPTLIHPDMRDEAMKFFGRQFVKGIQNTYLEYPLLTKEGHKLWCGQNTQLIFEDDHVVGFQAVARDITERKRTEEALKRSEERYRTILDEIEDGYQEVDLSGNFTFFNESFRKIFGYGENELLGSNFRRYAADEETADSVYRAYNQMYKTGNPLKRFEWDIITKDGARRSIEFSASLLRDGEGPRRGFRGIVRDVTDRKFVEEQYRTMANSAQTGVYIVQDGRLCFVNPHIPSYSGYPEEDLIGERVLHFVHPDDREMVREMARKMLAGELTAPYEYRIVDKNNQVRWIMETVTPISYKGRSAVLGNTMDITDRNRTEEELRQTLDSLRKAFGATIQVMVSAVEARDPYTAGHQIRSADLARAIATEMGLPQEKIDGIRMAGSIHDIGKLSIPVEILSKPTKLTNLEFSLIKEHSQKGYEMLKDVESPWPLAQIVYQHHERMDGSGYPRNLKGDDILIEARIMAVADVVESMASHRPYRPALGLNAALEQIENNKGTLYDADAADACLRLFREKGFQLEGA